MKEKFPLQRFKYPKIAVWLVGYFYNDDVVLESVKFENNLKPWKIEGVPISSPVSDYFTFCAEKENCEK